MDLSAWDERYSEDSCMPWTEFNGPGYHSKMPKGAIVHETRGALDYARALLRSGEPWRVQRAADIIAKVISLQDTDPTNATYGIWSWLLEEPLSAMSPPDWNWADFCGTRLAFFLVDHGDALPTELVSSIRGALGHAAWSIFRRNVQPGYTNIAIMGAGVALAAGEQLDEPRLVEYGRERLRRIVAHTEWQGEFTEYNSPTYTLVALDEAENILHLVRDSSARADAERLRRTAWRTIAEHYHPPTGQWGGPHSRTYRDLLNPDLIPSLLARPLGCPPEWVGAFRALPAPEVEIRRRFVRREDDAESIWGTTYLSQTACLGSANREKLWNQGRPLIAYWPSAGANAVVLRARFLHDGQDFASGCIRSDQKGARVLSVFGMITNGGDFHPTLDKPKDGVFRGSDFRFRYELSGHGALVEEIGEGGYRMSAGVCQAQIITLPGMFDGAPVRWEMTNETDRATLDAVCYSGPERTIVPSAMKETWVATGLEILAEGQPPQSEVPAHQETGDGQIRIAWAGTDADLSVAAPTVPEPWT